MQKKAVLIGTFIKKKNILSFLEKLKYRYHVSLNKVFVYLISDNDAEYLVTFKTYDREKYNDEFKSSTVMHVKNGCLFSINALNRLIQEKYGENVLTNEIEVDWNEYSGKLIVLANGQLVIKTITKIEDKCLFLG
jgi:hypothetical protein